MKLKNMALRLLAATLAFTTALISLVSCNNGGDTAGSVKIVICDTEAVEYEVNLADIGEGDGIIPVLEYLKTNKNVNYTSQDSGYGAYLTELGALKEDALAGKFLYVYTSVEADFDVSQYAVTVEYNGQTLTSSGVGLSAMTVKDGAVIYFTYY